MNKVQFQKSLSIAGVRGLIRQHRAIRARAHGLALTKRLRLPDLQQRTGQIVSPRHAVGLRLRPSKPSRPIRDPAIGYGFQKQDQGRVYTVLEGD